MRELRRFVAVIVAAFVPATGCLTVLGDFQSSAPDAGWNGLGFDGTFPDTSSSVIDSGSTQCSQAGDCPVFDTVPAGCAVADCVSHFCKYTAADKDGDGHGQAGCVGKNGIPVSGDDCDDNNPLIYPGAACRKLPDGTDIVFPNGTPVGACRAGTWQCTSTGPVCQGAIGPQPAEDCNLHNDANCNGIPDDGCDCTPGAAGSCGNVNNLPLPCKAGSRSCSAQGKWGVCGGNIEPKQRDCTSGLDNDCNSSADSSEAACLCPGNVPIGGIAACVVPGAKGICLNGTQKCQATLDKLGGWYPPGSCSGPAPQPRDCSSAQDNNCDGTPDMNEAACQCPGNVGVGKTGACIVGGAKGICANGQQTCLLSADKQTVSFGPCAGTAPQPLNCASPQDNNCNGTPDELEVPCGSPCLDPLGTGGLVPAVDKFNANMWGCPGRRNWIVRASACGPNGGTSSVCTVAAWVAYTRAGGKPPTHQYWVSEKLNYGGSQGVGTCNVAANAAFACTGVSPNMSMAVCVPSPNGLSSTDGDSNTCNWTMCTSGPPPGPVDQLGGCINADTAGTLCCKP